MTYVDWSGREQEDPEGDAMRAVVVPELVPTAVGTEVDDRESEVYLLEPRETFDPCLVGIARQFNRRFAVYDEAKVLEAFAEMFAEDDDPELAAREWFEFNVVGAWLGEGTPAFTAPMETEEDE